VGWDIASSLQKCHQLMPNMLWDAHHFGFITKLGIMNIKKNQNMGFFDFLNIKKNIDVINKIKE
jgi:hypothetical protein